MPDRLPIAESHRRQPFNPYALSKILAEDVIAFHEARFQLRATVIRPFNTYGPFQKSNSEGGVVSIFLKRDIAGEPLLVKGSGMQTRDLLYVEDCADFIVRASACFACSPN